MTLIEGVGDEVTDFFIVVGVIVVGWIAWCSTNISEQPLIRTVLILQHRTRTRIAELRANHTTVITDNFNSRATNFEESSANEETTEPSNQSSDETEQTCLLENQNVPETSETSTTEPATGAAASEEVLIQAMDSETADSELRDQSKLESESPKTSITGPNQTSGAPASVPSVDSIDGGLLDQGEEIIIKLKFINDDQRIVSGRPKEMLGDFKKRHFQAELDSQKRVRLVFNGHVLQPDTDTLEQCGLYNNCVVHCLVHQQRTTAPTTTHSALDASSSFYSNPQSFQNMPPGANTSVHNEWDLSRLLVGLITLVLIVAWYSRYYYAQLFTAAATLALYALTAVFTLSVVGHFFPDQDSLRNIE